MNENDKQAVELKKPKKGSWQKAWQEDWLSWLTFSQEQIKGVSMPDGKIMPIALDLMATRVNGKPSLVIQKKD